MVDVSWTAKPCGRSSRSMMLRCPPELAPCAWAGVAVTSQATPQAAPRTSHRAAATRKRVMVLLLFTPVGRARAASSPWAGTPRIAAGRTRGTGEYTRMGARSQPFCDCVTRCVRRRASGSECAGAPLILLESGDRHQPEDADPRRHPQGSDLLQYRFDRVPNLDVP